MAGGALLISEAGGLVNICANPDRYATILRLRLIYIY
jgi:hypothetical protein